MLTRFREYECRSLWPVLLFYEMFLRFGAWAISKTKKRPCFRKAFFGWMTGLEPATSRITIWDSNQLSYIHHVARPNIKKPSQISRDGNNFFPKNLFLERYDYFFCMIRRKFARLKSFLCSMQKRGYTYCFGKMRIVNVLLQPSRQHLNSKSMASV